MRASKEWTLDQEVVNGYISYEGFSFLRIYVSGYREDGKTRAQAMH